MVSRRIFKKFIPEEIKLPKASFEVSFTQDLNERKRNNIEKMVKTSPVFYDIKARDFYFENKGVRCYIKTKEVKGKIPEYIPNRIKVDLPDNFFHVSDASLSSVKFCYFDPFSERWSWPSRQIVETKYEPKLYKHLADLFGSSIAEYNKAKGRNLKSVNVAKLSYDFVNKMLAKR